MTETEDIIKAMKNQDILSLRALAGEFSDEASISQSKEALNLAIITYSLNKIYSKIHMREKIAPLEEKVISQLTEGDVPAAMTEIFEFDRQNGLFHDGLDRKARVKIGSRLYSQGISMNQAASLVGVHVTDIQDYVGDTKDHDEHHGKSLEERLQAARNALK